MLMGEREKREILRYLGAGHSDAGLDAMIERAWKETGAAARPRHIARLVDAESRGDTVILDGEAIGSRSLAGHLAGCGQAFLFACTLGPGVDTLIKRFSIVEMPMAPVLQACAAAFIEAYADEAQKELEAYGKEHGLYLRPRYSPGYGDFPLSCQRFFFAALDITKRLGVSLTENCMMVPFKSITAVVGLSADPSLCHVHRCMSCTALDCPFRKEAV